MIMMIIMLLIGNIMTTATACATFIIRFCVVLSAVRQYRSIWSRFRCTLYVRTIKVAKIQTIIVS